MTLYDFILLNEEQKVTTVWQGNFLAMREDKCCKVILYRIKDFYVEIYYNTEHHLIRWIRPFKAPRFLHAYFNDRLN